VVLQFRSYKAITILTGHHQASAGGTSISQLENDYYSDGTPQASAGGVIAKENQFNWMLTG
jgi:hypothetical protein